MAVDLDDRAVDHRELHVRIIRQGVKNPLEYIAFDPIAKALEHGIPVAKTRRQITLRGAGAGDPQNRLQKQPPIPAGTTRVRFLAQTIRFNQRPLTVTENKTIRNHSNLL